MNKIVEGLKEATNFVAKEYKLLLPDGTWTKWKPFPKEGITKMAVKLKAKMLNLR